MENKVTTSDAELPSQQQGVASYGTVSHHKVKPSHIWDHMSSKSHMGIIYGFQIIYGHRFQITYGPYMIIYGPYMDLTLGMAGFMRRA